MELKDFCDAGALRTLLRGRAIAGASAGTGRGPVLVSASGGQAGGSPWASTPRPYTWEWVAGGKWEHESGSEVILQRGSSGNCGAACCACRPGLGGAAWLVTPQRLCQPNRRCPHLHDRRAAEPLTHRGAGQTSLHHPRRGAGGARARIQLAAFAWLVPGLQKCCLNQGRVKRLLLTACICPPFT